MEISSSFEKRIKRRITGRDHEFFAVCSPGLKKVCQTEMRATGFPENDMRVIEGGIEYKAKPDICMAFNLNLRSPSRILMRISRFKATSFKELEKKIDAIDWILYLPQNCSIKMTVTTKKSRLYHSDAIARRCEKIILNHLNINGGVRSIEKNTSNQTIFIRADHDHFIISLDSTGDLLFKRGIKKKVALAPLRETIAFAMLSRARFSTEDILIDPMCGSGTFSLEAAMMKTNIPPGFFRAFAFENWPGFSHKTFAYQKKQAEKQFLSFSDKQIFASDIDDTAIAALKNNIAHHEFTRIIDISKKDFFSILPSGISPGRKGVIMLNPPYGKRLGKKNNTKKFYRNIGKKLVADFKGWRVAIILPSPECTSYLGMKLDLKPVFHGGLDIFTGIAVIV